MKFLKWIFSVAAFAAAIQATNAGDDRLGFDCHFDHQGGSPNWNPDLVMPMIAKQGAGAYIRDEINWGLAETSPGVYSMPDPKQHWLDEASANGLKVVACIGENPPAFYSNPWNPATPAANFCAWLAKTEGPKIAAIEVINEPNNAFASQVGANWKSTLSTLTNAIADAVHASSPGTLVIGLGGQGQQVLDMLKMGTHADGVVYHPYDKGDSIPEHTYEPPYTDYQTWVAAVRAATNLPIWETECAISSGGNNGEYHSAIWDARRLTLAAALGVQHTFLYDYCDPDIAQTVLDYWQAPRQRYFVEQRLYSLIGGMTPTGRAVMVNSSDSNYSRDNFKGFVFANQDNSSACAIVWEGNQMLSGPIGASENPIVIATLTVPNSAAVSSVVATDIISGKSWQPAWSRSGDNIVIQGANISSGPIAYAMMGGGPTPAPTSTPSP